MNWSLPTEEIFQVHGQNRSVAYLLVVDFRSQKSITKATEYVTFGFSSRILVFFPFQESLNVTVCKRHGFFILLAAIIENKNDLGLRVDQPDREARKESDVSTADRRYQTLVKKHRIFSRLLLQLFSGLEILV